MKCWEFHEELRSRTESKASDIGKKESRNMKKKKKIESRLGDEEKERKKKKKMAGGFNIKQATVTQPFRFTSSPFLCSPCVFYIFFFWGGMWWGWSPYLLI